MAVGTRLEGGRRGGGASSVTAQLDVRLRGLDVIDHGAELVDEAHQSHVHPLADGLAGYGEVAVEGVVVAPVEVMEGESSCGGALWGTAGLLHHHCVQAEGLDEESGLELQRGEVHRAAPSDAHSKRVTTCQQHLFQARQNLPSGLFVLAFFRGVRVNDVRSETLEVARERQMFPKIHPVAQRGGVLSLDAGVAQQRLEDDLNVEAERDIPS